MRDILTAITLCVYGLIPSAILAQDRPVVVELFTSQGCSSCPPADAYLHELAKRSDVIALALHVDYWDYIGWKDSFADPAFTQRQRGYAREQQERVVYTPQIMVNGVEHAVGNRRSEVAALISKHIHAPSVVEISAQRRNGHVEVKLDSTLQVGDYDVFLVTYAPKNSVRILRGENAGKTINYSNVVLDWRSLGRWNGRAGIRLTGPQADTGKQVVIVQRRSFGEIVSAAHVK